MVSPFEYGAGNKQTMVNSIIKIIVIIVMPQRTMAVGRLPSRFLTFSERVSL